MYLSYKYKLQIQYSSRVNINYHSVSGKFRPSVKYHNTILQYTPKAYLLRRDMDTHVELHFVSYVLFNAIP